ncbi:MAG TPA: PLP-dependent aminotransferase family protein [Candidatus Baltobacteraceae bacterium]|jgi:GntR family transcriptional regulator/MocR family aminotransferase
MVKSYRGIVLDLKSETPLHRQLTSAFRDAILSGKLQPGERISSSRELQACYGISRNTALNALSQLQAEGHVVTVRGSGTFVAGEPDAVPESGAVPFRPGIPDLDLFPVDLVRRSLSTLEWSEDLRDDPRTWANDGLRTAIVQRLRQTRGIDCSPDQVLIVPSTEYAISLIGRALLQPHDSVVIEDPGHPKLRCALLGAGAQIVPALVDEEGIDVASFARRRAALAYVTPSHQYPTGAALSLERRFALLDWAAEFGAWIVEDDYDNEFDYRCRPQPTLQSLDEGRRVLYVGTFSNVLSPSIRIAYLIAPRRLCATLEAAHQARAGYVSPFLQAALAAFMERGHFARHVARMRKIYDERRRFLSFALGSTGLRVHDCGAGLHFIADVPEHLSDRDVSARALERGVVVPPLSSYSHGLSAFNGLMFGFAATSMPVARTAVKALLKAL